jgi:hypothetical protein
LGFLTCSPARFLGLPPVRKRSAQYGYPTQSSSKERHASPRVPRLSSFVPVLRPLRRLLLLLVYIERLSRMYMYTVCMYKGLRNHRRSEHFSRDILCEALRPSTASTGTVLQRHVWWCDSCEHKCRLPLITASPSQTSIRPTDTRGLNGGQPAEPPHLFWEYLYGSVCTASSTTRNPRRSQNHQETLH